MSSPVPPDSILRQMEAGLDAIEADIKAGSAPEKTVEPPSTAVVPDAPVVKTEEAAPPAPTAEVSSPPSTPSRSKDYEDWLTKWGGPDRDPDVAARASWDMNNRLSQAAKPETKAPEPAPPAKEPEPVHPDVARFDETLRAIKERYDEVNEDFKTTTTQAKEVAARIRAIERSRAFDDLDIEEDQKLVKELRSKYQESERLQNALAGLRREAAELSSSHEVQSTLKSQAETLVKLTQAREAETLERNRATEDAALQQFSVTFFDQLDKIAKEGDAIPDELRDRWKKFAKRESHVKLNVEDLATTDIPAFLRDVKKEFLEDVDQAHRIKSKTYAAQKLKDADVQAPDGAAAVAEKKKTTGFRSQADVDRFMEEAAASL